MVRLIVYHQNQRLGVDLKDGVYRIGREKPADVVIPDTTVSGNHAELQVSGDTCTLRDLGSRNGTFVNGQQVRAARQVKPADEIRVGAVRIALEVPDEIKPPVAHPASASPLARPTAKMEAAKVAASNMAWTVKNWIAAAEAILFLLILFFVIQLYAESVASKVRLANRYKALASQYVHILGNPEVKTIPAPVTDQSMKQPIMVADGQGKILYPPAVQQPDGTVKTVVSPLVNPKTGKLYEAVRWGMSDVKVSGERKELDTVAKSYPVKIGGDTAGFVVAQPAEGDSESALSSILSMMLVSALVSLIVVYFLLTPVHQLVRSQIDALRSKISPLFNGFADELPRSQNVKELSVLADEIEKSLDAYKAEVARGGREGGRAQASEYAPLVAPMADTAKLPYCFVNTDFAVVNLSESIATIDELARAAVGQSLFDAGMTNIQSKQLVRSLSEARKNGRDSTRITFTRAGSQQPFDVSVRSFNQAGGKEILGILFSLPPIEN